VRSSSARWPTHPGLRGVVRLIPHQVKSRVASCGGGKVHAIGWIDAIEPIARARLDPVDARGE
jgi:hypothetical protein